ncbi:MAG TPA: YicC family protein, partial [Candidatus Eisenbacteria bacterium]|nr:YicC family protein [Candidatus Eisenbacteria bacterium]
MQSMTGYGRGEARVGEGTVRVEVRTVNHRFLEFTTRIPRSLYGREKEIERIAR